MKFSQWINIFELLGVMAVLSLALIFQFGLGELPCPLCLLQRIGFLGVAFGFLLNFRFGFRPSHYAIVLMSALFTSFVALRQVSLHVLPGTGAYGDAVFGLHMYTWSFIISMMIVITTTVLLGVDKQYFLPLSNDKVWRYWAKLLFAAMLVTIAANIYATYSVCGLHMCPDNPISPALTLFQ
jgi:disulfide bond formation protein DsbB